MSVLLGVNIDHVATVRQAREAAYPDPVLAAALAERAGADQITCHIRMDRRHIQERDLRLLKEIVRTRLNVEMAATDEMMKIALELRPQQITLVPEREGEVTTEGGLDLRAEPPRAEVRRAVQALAELGIEVGIFVDPDAEQVQATADCGAKIIELNTAAYAEAKSAAELERELERVELAAKLAARLGLNVAAGHGLHYHNVQALVELDLIAEFNIGHSIIGRALFSGLEEAVRDMKALLQG